MNDPAPQKDSASPGQILKVQIPITVSVIVVLGVIVMTWLYAHKPNSRPTIAFLGAGMGVAAGVVSAFYVGKALKITIEQRARDLTDQKIARAFAFLERWNDPNFATLRSEWRKVLDEFEGRGSDALCAELQKSHERRTVVVDVLNFFEELSYAGQSGVADLSTLKALFRTILERYFSALKPWIEKHRNDKHQPTAYEHFEWLRDQWKTG